MVTHVLPPFVAGEGARINGGVDAFTCSADTKAPEAMLMASKIVAINTIDLICGNERVSILYHSGIKYRDILNHEGSRHD
jgi:hypothetical protein